MAWWLIAGWLSTLVAVIVALSGGIAFHVVGPVSIRAHSALPAIVFAIVCFGLAARRGFAPLGQSLERIWTALDRHAAAFALAAAIAATTVGLVWGTYVAGGPDSYCYLNQAEMLSRGEVRQAQSIVDRAPWPNAAATFAPTAHLPAAGHPNAIVPACPGGYPLLMAAAKWIGGRTAMFWITPILGGVAVWLTFLLGRTVAGPVAGLAASSLLAASPAFLYQITQPMTDVPAVALWCAALLASIRISRSAGAPIVAGVLTGAALLIRPNLLPLAGVVGLQAGRAFRQAILFAIGALPFVVAILALNHAMHGSPFDSGYGSAATLFTLDHTRGNLQRYPVWLIETQTPFVLLAFAAPWTMPRDNRPIAWWLLAFAIVTFACYVPYTVWDAWWFLRFVLPAFPPLLILSCTVAVSLTGRARPATRTAMLIVLFSALMLFQINTAARRAAFELRNLEARFRVAGEYVARRLPPNAVVFAVTESGSIRFYSGRQTIFWEKLDPAWLDRSVDFLTAAGYQPYFLFESDEEPPFRERFGALSAIGQLDWPPIADIDRQVRIYDPADRVRYRAGERVVTDYVMTSGVSHQRPE